MIETSTPQGLKKLEPPNGTPPKERVQSAVSLQSILLQLFHNDSKRSFKRAKLDGLAQGNPPYSPAKLREIGRADAANVNWGTARSYLEQSEGIFYDLFSEAPVFFQVEVKGFTPDENDMWGQVMSEVAHEVLSDDPKWDFVIQNSIRNMVFHGCGPLYFEDRNSVIPRFAPAGDLKVPDNSESDTAYWEIAYIAPVNYKCHQLYEKIENEAAAKKAGWNVEFVKRCLMNAVPERQRQGITLDWQWYQTQVKQNSFSSYYDTDVVRLAHVYWKEYDGTITHAIIETEATGSGDSRGSDVKDGVKPTDFLYKFNGKYKDWPQVLHPCYFDKGYGRHYTVEGLGIKMYSALVYENRLLCNLADKAMAPTVLFRPLSQSSDPFNLKPMGDYAKMAAGWEMQQLQVTGHLEDGLAMRNALSQTMANNLAQYRQTWNRSQGNPPTLGQVRIEQQQQFSVAGTQIARYYKQLDILYKEIVSRLCNTTSTDPLAKSFQEKCLERGVLKEAFSKVSRVQAARVSGQGSASLRQASLDSIMGAIARLPEDGQDALMTDWIASRTGYRNARRYYPERRKDKMGNEQESDAMQQVAGMKIGVPPVITPSQDPVIYASAFFGAAGQAAGTVPKGANPMEVLQFLDIAVPAGIAHLQRFANDPSREGVAKQMTKMAQDLGQFTDQLKKQVQQQMEQAQSQGPQGPQLPPEVQQQLMIEDAKGKQKIQNMALSHQQRMTQRAQIHAQQMAEAADKARLDATAKDVLTAADIRAKRLQAQAKASEPKPVTKT